MKEEIRRIDVKQGFHPEGQAESQDFYGGDYTDLLMKEDERGDIVFKDGTKIGEHDGFWHYTIGQRKGLGIAYSEPLYVISLDPERNLVIVGTKEDTMRSRALCSSVNSIAWLGFEDKEYSIKIRSTSPGSLGRVRAVGPDSLEIDFASSVNAITPGQSAVIYDGDVVVASSIIERVL